MIAITNEDFEKLQAYHKLHGEHRILREQVNQIQSHADQLAEALRLALDRLKFHSSSDAREVSLKGLTALTNYETFKSK